MDEATLGAVGGNNVSIPEEKFKREDKFKHMEIDDSNSDNVMGQSKRHGSIFFLN